MLEKSCKLPGKQHGKLVEIQHGPATVSAEDRSTRPLFQQGTGRLTGPAMRESGDRPARFSMSPVPRDHMLNQL